MVEMKTQLTVKVKDGNGGVLVLPAGLPVTFGQVDGGLWRAFVSHESRVEPYRVRIGSAFKEPSLNSLERWSNDGVCKSIGGKRVEPDGTDENGAPSWLLALGMI
jgi:hypothetical protein